VIEDAAIHAQFSRLAEAPAARTLLDIFNETVALYPDQPALDNGESSLSYAQLSGAVQEMAGRLAGAGVGAGERVGVRLQSGSHQLYIAILGILAAGAAYVPVDADDPDERAALVFGVASVKAILEGSSPLSSKDSAAGPVSGPTLTDDAWIIFTSGSTGTPKGVAVSHRSAAAFVDAEARLFLLRKAKVRSAGQRWLAMPLSAGAALGVKRQLRGCGARPRGEHRSQQRVRRHESCSVSIPQQAVCSFPLGGVQRSGRNLPCARTRPRHLDCHPHMVTARRAQLSSTRRAARALR